MASRERLGKGLDALFPADGETPPFFGAAITGDASNGDDGAVLEAEDAGGAFALPVADAGAPGGERLVPLENLRPNPHQPRRHFDEAALEELAASIREHGVIEPPIVEGADGGWTIVAGERRVRAARLAGLEAIPVIVRSFSEAERMEIALIENIQREDLSPVEEASAYQKLMEIAGLTQDEVAARVGKNRSTVANALRLLRLPPAMLAALEAGTLSPGHGRALLSVNGGAARERLFGEIAARGLSVREVEKRAAALNAPPDGGLDGGLDTNGAAIPAKNARDPELAGMEQRFIDTLGTKVTIAGDLSRGTIRIDYFSMDDLDRLLCILERRP
ncbi:MAG: ParB/RepB/Spo0J family partition protein [Spirochaetaceae bacterium]|nr:ParB/RepB/Spo0J family partition protein [Spirochaetaceae bacterium]